MKERGTDATQSEQSALAKLRSMASDHAEAIRLACVWEATAAKVGNVHPQAAFDDCCFDDFCAAAAAVAPILAGSRPGATSLGERILAAIAATQAVTRANVNLGIVLLIGPLGLARDRPDVARVLRELTPEDGAKIYRAIALAGPGGMDTAGVDRQWDVRAAPPPQIDLVAAMRSASQRDRIARQYATDFDDFFEHVVPVVSAELQAQQEIGEAIVRAQLRLLAAEPDSLILRKCGVAVASEVCDRAAACRAAEGTWDADQRQALDRWLRAEGNRRNPGTTADLIAAAIYWILSR